MPHLLAELLSEDLPDDCVSNKGVLLPQVIGSLIEHLCCQVRRGCNTELCQEVEEEEVQL